MDDDGKAAAQVVAVFKKAEPPRQFVLKPGDVLVFGRAGDCDVVLPARGISSRHAILRHKLCASGGSEMFLEDTSTNGTGTFSGDQTTWSPLRKGESRLLETTLQVLLPLNSKEESAVLTICVFGEGLPDAYDERRRVGRWLYRGKLGEGALGIVHKASDLTGKLGEAVAIKVAKTAKGAKKTSKLRNAFILHREAQWSLQRLHNKKYSGFSAEKAKLFARYLEDHTGTWSDLDFDSERKLFEGQEYRWDKFKPAVAIPEKPYVAIEYVPGRTLHTALGWSREQPLQEGQGILDEEERHLVAKQAAEALTYLISQNLIHRDFRTTNLMIVGKGPEVSVRVIDLGHTILAEPGHQRNKSPIVRCNMKEEDKKRFEWAPPEVKAKEHFLNFALPVHSFDVFSMAVLAVQLQEREHSAARVAVDRLMGIQSGDCISSAMGLPQEFLRLMLGMPLKRPPIEEIQRLLNQKRKAVSEAESVRQSKRQATAPCGSGSMDKSPTVELASESDNPHPPTSVVEYDDAPTGAGKDEPQAEKAAAQNVGSAVEEDMAEAERAWDQLEKSAEQQSKVDKPGNDHDLDLLAPLPDVDDLLNHSQLEKESRGAREVTHEQQRDRHAQPSQLGASAQPIHTEQSGNANPERMVQASQHKKPAQPAERPMSKTSHSASIEQHSQTKQEKLPERVERSNKPVIEKLQVLQAGQPGKAAVPIQTELPGQSDQPEQLASVTQPDAEDLQTMQTKQSGRLALHEHQKHVEEQHSGQQEFHVQQDGVEQVRTLPAKQQDESQQAVDLAQSASPILQSAQAGQSLQPCQSEQTVQTEQQQPVLVEIPGQPDRAGNLEPMPSKQSLLEQTANTAAPWSQNCQSDREAGNLESLPSRQQSLLEQAARAIPPWRQNGQSVQVEQPVHPIQMEQLARVEQEQHVHVQQDQAGVAPPPAKQQELPGQSSQPTQPDPQKAQSLPVEQPLQPVEPKLLLHVEQQVPAQLDLPEQSIPPPAMQQTSAEQPAHSIQPSAQEVQCVPADAAKSGLREPLIVGPQPLQAESLVQARQDLTVMPARKRQFAQPLQPGLVKPGLLQPSLLSSSGSLASVKQADVIDQPSLSEEPGARSFEQAALEFSGPAQSERVSWLLQQLQQVRRTSKPQVDTIDEPHALQKPSGCLDASISEKQLQERRLIESDRHFSKASAVVPATPEQPFADPGYGPCRLPPWRTQMSTRPHITMPNYAAFVPASSVPDMASGPHLVLPMRSLPNTTLPNSLSPDYARPRAPFPMQAASLETSRTKTMQRFQTQSLPRPRAGWPY